MQRNLPKTEPQETEIFRCGKVPYNIYLKSGSSGIHILETDKSCPLSTDFRYSQVPFKRGFTV